MPEIGRFLWTNFLAVFYLIEMGLAALWVGPYWRTGLVAYSRPVRNRALSSGDIFAALQADAALRGTLAFRQIAPDLIAFREQFRRLAYTPFMRGEVGIPVEGGSATVRGRVYWHIPALLLLPVLYGHARLLFVAVPAAAAIFYLIFRKQRELFDAVERTLDRPGDGLLERSARR